MDNILQNLAVLIRNSLWLAPLLALAAGVLTSFTPCSLSSIPLVIGYVSGIGEKSSLRAFFLSLVFAIGSAITYTTLGVFASIAGGIMGYGSKWWYILLGILMILMALQTWEVVQIIPSTYLVSKSKKKGFIGAFIAGVLAGVFTTPCSTPILIALMTIVAQRGSLFWGIILFILYSIGNGVLVVAVGTSVGLARKIATNEKYGNASRIIKIILGTIILLIGLYMLYIGF